VSQSKKIISKKNRTELVAFLVLLAILFLFLSAYFSLKNNNIFTSILTSIESDKRSKKLITPTPRPIAQGKQTYSTQGGSKTGPKVSKVVVDPFDPKTGEKQMFEVKIKDTTPVITVTLTLKTDHGEKNYPLKLFQGKDTDGLWSISFETEDKHDYVYTATITAENNKKEKNKIVLSFR